MGSQKINYLTRKKNSNFCFPSVTKTAEGKDNFPPVFPPSFFNFHTVSGLLHKGDGAWLDLRSLAPKANLEMGTGDKRAPGCTGDCLRVRPAASSPLLNVVSMASGPDGSLFVGDFNLIRRVFPDGRTKVVLDLGQAQADYHYELSVSPNQRRILVAVAEKRQVLTVKTLDAEEDYYDEQPEGDDQDPWEVFAGNGRRCLPGDKDHCGDGGQARMARLDYPKSVAVAADGTAFISDGRSLRIVSPSGVIDTLLGSAAGARVSGPPKPLPCRRIFEVRDVQPQWPTKLAIDPVDGTLHLVDDTLVLRLTSDMRAHVVAGKSPLCNKEGEDGKDTNEDELGHVVDMAFSQKGELYLAERRPKPQGARIRILDREGLLRHFAGGPEGIDQDCLCTNVLNCTSSALKEGCPKRGRSSVLSHELRLGSASALSVTPDGVVHVADNSVLQIVAFKSSLPDQDPSTGDVRVADLQDKELYSFNRHGQHVFTHSLETGALLYSFSYSKNTVFGRLTVASDALGNKVSLHRDYSGRVQSMENTYGQKRSVTLSRLGRLEAIETDAAGGKVRFHYDEAGGLLTSVSSGDGRFKSFEYDENGRPTSVTLDSGESFQLSTSVVGKNCRRGQRSSKENEEPWFCAEVIRNSGGGAAGAIGAEVVLRAKVHHRSGRVKLLLLSGGE